MQILRDMFYYRDRTKYKNTLLLHNMTKSTTLYNKSQNLLYYMQKNQNFSKNQHVNVYM